MVDWCIFTVTCGCFFLENMSANIEKYIFSTTHMDGMSYMSIVVAILDQRRVPAFQMSPVPINFFVDLNEPHRSPGV